MQNAGNQHSCQKHKVSAGIRRQQQVRISGNSR